MEELTNASTLRRAEMVERGAIARYKEKINGSLTDLKEDNNVT